MTEDIILTEQEASSTPSRADWLPAATLAVATAAFVVWQNSRLTVLWDLSYILENAARMASGDVPYRDFPFPYAPLTFSLQALIIRIFGRAIWHHVAYATVAGGAATAATFWIVRCSIGRMAAFILVLPLIPLGIYSIFPHPFYDPDACLVVLLILAGLMVAQSSRARFAVGVAAVVPLFVKQNIGLAFLIAMVGLVLASRDRRRSLPIFAGIACGAAAAAAVVAGLFGAGNYVRWTLRFAASRRMPPMRQYLEIYTEPIIWWWILAAIAGGLLIARRFRIIGPAVVAAPFIWSVYRIFITDDPTEREVNLLRFWPMLIVCGIIVGLRWLWQERSFRGVVPLLAAAAIAGAFLSQSAWGSTYGMWPLLIMLIAVSLRTISGEDRRVEIFLAAVIATAILFGGVPYVVRSERLTYVKLDGPMHRSTLRVLRGLSERGEWLPEFEQLVAWSDLHIPRGDGILSLPGEDLFYFTTGRRPRFPVLMFDHTVNPFDAPTLARLVVEKDIRWIIVKKRLQLNGEPMTELAETLRLLRPRFAPVAELSNYTIYGRR